MTSVMFPSLLRTFLVPPVRLSSLEVNAQYFDVYGVYYMYTFGSVSTVRRSHPFGMCRVLLKLKSKQGNNVSTAVRLLHAGRLYVGVRIRHSLLYTGVLLCYICSVGSARMNLYAPENCLCCLSTAAKYVYLIRMFFPPREICTRSLVRLHCSIVN